MRPHDAHAGVLALRGVPSEPEPQTTRMRTRTKHGLAHALAEARDRGTAEGIEDAAHAASKRHPLSRETRLPGMARAVGSSEWKAERWRMAFEDMRERE